MVSRSFGRSITSKKILSETISFHASRAAEKLGMNPKNVELLQLLSGRIGLITTSNKFMHRGI